MTTAPLPWNAAGLLLDMDGTLVDSTPSVVRSWDRLFEELGVEQRYEHSLHGMPARRILEMVLPHHTPEEREAAFRRVEQLEIEDAHTVTILPGTLRLLAELDVVSQQIGRPTWTVVTSATRELFQARWEATALPLPEGFVTIDQTERGKPDPDPYLLGAERLGISPADAVVIEDSPGGLRAARDAGARRIAVTTTQTAADLDQLADALTTSLDDLTVTAHDGHVRLARRGA